MLRAVFDSIDNIIIMLLRPDMSIRFARKADCAAIAEIYNHAVLYTAAIWNDQTVDADNALPGLKRGP
ncbi:acetyltransferase, GNAT family [Shigella dysenteriae]|uniref:Acetyltransferase, GNAT family n=1 Tax=Shigella dysenteriae TaxID=622 RepID=A0A2X2IBD4_SHIDY|nr:acetyltransferase, GNAT family [Shigella dysenteriae]